MPGNSTGYQVHISHLPNAKNEDRYSQTFLTKNGSDVTILGVYDGHGGPNCAEFISDKLPATIATRLKRDGNGTVTEELTSTFLEVDKGLLDCLHDCFKSYFSWPMPRTVRQKAIDSKLRQDRVKKIALRARSGATGLVVVIEDEYITLANVGDCRAVLGRTASSDAKIEAVALTVDQNGENDAECKRILSEHPSSEAETLLVGGRLFGHMAVTRSFGDAFFKEPDIAYTEYVFGSAELTNPGRLPFNENMSRFYPLVQTPPYLTAVPEITRHRISKEDQFLIIASDGVWGLKGVTNEWAISTVAEGYQKDVDPAQVLVEEVKKLRPGDDITVVVVVFATKTAD